jgi:hypothetical protein
MPPCHGSWYYRSDRDEDAMRRWLSMCLASFIPLVLPVWDGRSRDGGLSPVPRDDEDA